MKLTAKLSTLLSITLAHVAIAVPASMGTYDRTFREFWLWGLVYSSKDGIEFGGIENILALAAPVFLVTVILGIGPLVHSLVSKTADKWLNQYAAGFIIFCTAIAYLSGVYVGAGLFLYGNIPIGLLITFVAGLFGFWAAHLTRQEKASERQTAEKGM